MYKYKINNYYMRKTTNYIHATF